MAVLEISLLGEEWVDITGRKTEAEFVSLENDIVSLRKIAKVYKIHIGKLSTISRRKARDWQKGKIYRFLVSNKFIFQTNDGYDNYDDLNACRFARDGDFICKPRIYEPRSWRLEGNVLILHYTEWEEIRFRVIQNLGEWKIEPERELESIIFKLWDKHIND